jgi:hypothetical protein
MRTLLSVVNLQDKLIITLNILKVIIKTENVDCFQGFSEGNFVPEMRKEKGERRKGARACLVLK